MKNFYDSHCHLFTRKETLNLRLLFEIIFGFPKEDAKGPELKKSLTAKENFFDRIRDKIQQLKRVLNFLRTGFSDTEEDIYKLMQDCYGKKINIAPLMFDLECVFVANRFGGTVDFASHQETIVAEFDKVIVDFHANTEKFIEEAMLFITGIKMVDRLKHDHSDMIELQQLHNELKNELQQFKNNKIQGQNLQLSLISNYDIQLKDISALKVKYPRNVYPFIAIDPRREGIIDKFINEIYRKKVFCGVKLYTPNGYSPTDIDLMKKGGLYDFCVKKNIPITAHHSFAGFATPLSSVEIDGYIYDKGLKEVHGPVELSKAFSEDWVQERAMRFNHPDIWEKVMQAYPTLKLNLAHFGNGNPDWQKKIYSLISNRNYPNMHTDLSCWCNIEDQGKKEIGLQTFYNKYYKDAPDYVKSKILYGSDFYLDLLYVNSLADFYKNFKKVFPKSEFKRIAVTNAEKFLGVKKMYDR
jgi:predicted TIM-barrel fold metal-dependent hydrolase